MNCNWIINDLENLDKLNVIKSTEYTCWLYRENNDYFITDTKTKLNVQLDLRLSIQNDFCVAVKLKKYLYTALVRYKLAKTESYLLILVDNYDILDRNCVKTSEKFDSKSLKFGYHSALKQLEKTFNLDKKENIEPKGEIATPVRVVEKKQETSNSAIVVRKAKESYVRSSNVEPTNESNNLSNLINEMSVGSLKNFTIDLIEPNKPIKNPNLNHAFNTQSESLGLSDRQSEQANILESQTDFLFNENSLLPGSNGGKLACSTLLNTNSSLTLNIDENCSKIQTQNSNMTSQDDVVAKQTGNRLPLSVSSQILHDAFFGGQVSTQVETGSKDNVRNDINTKFVTSVSPISNQKQQQLSAIHEPDSSNLIDEMDDSGRDKTEQNRRSSPTEGLNRKGLNETETRAEITNDEDEGDDDSLDAIWIEPDRVIEETNRKTQISKDNDENSGDLTTTTLLHVPQSASKSTATTLTQIESTQIHRRAATRLLSVASSHSSTSDFSSISESYTANTNTRKRKRRLLSNNIGGLFYDDKTSSSPSSSLNTSPTSSVASSPQSAQSCVFELCSQSLIFARKNHQAFRVQKSLTDTKRYTKSELPSIFAPISKSATKSTTATAARVSRHSSSTVDSPGSATKVLQNSQIIDNILTNKELSQKTNRRRCLFSGNTQDYVEQAFVDRPDVQPAVSAKKSTAQPSSSKKFKKIVCYDTTHIENEMLDELISSNSPNHNTHHQVASVNTTSDLTVKNNSNSNETSIPLGQQPPLGVSSLNGSVSGSNESDKVLRNIKSAIANIPYNINPNDLQDLIKKRLAK